jgi:RNA polymerase sigma factor (TIGR02999 family)
MSQTPITLLLRRIGEGDRQAEHDLLPLVYEELHRLAERALRGERPGHTLQATALVHEAWLRFSEGEAPSWKDRGHFLRVAARAMRNVLVDHARARRAAKREMGPEYVARMMETFEQRSIDVLALHEAVEKLGKVDEELALLVELRFFAGLSIDETAVALETSPASVDRGWRLARAWLRTEIPDPGADRS